MNHQDVIDYVSQEFELFRAEKEIPGIAFGIMHKGTLIYSAGLGEKEIGSKATPTADSVFRIASMTKSFTATAILKLRDSGLVKLYEPITTYLPWSASIGLPEGSAPITVRDLLTMGAGLPTDDPWGDRQEDLSIADFDAMVEGGLTFNRAANTAFEYSNLSYALLGRIIAVVTGESYESFVTREILEPLRMTSSTFYTGEIPDLNRAVGYVNFDTGFSAEPTTLNGAFTPMGGLHSTVNDVARWMSSFHNDRAEQQTPFRFAQAWMAESIDELPERIVTSSYGYGLFIDDDTHLGRSVHHSGGYPGYGSHMRWHQDSGWAIVALGNVTYAPMRVIGTKIINHLAHQHKKSRTTKLDLTPATFAAMDAVNSLINKWDEELANKWFTENMDLDQPREERVALFQKLTTGKLDWAPIAESIYAPTRSFVKWRVRSGVQILEVELLMSPEKSQRIQKVVLRNADA